jgi:uncharacterized protein YkwD
MFRSPALQGMPARARLSALTAAIAAALAILCVGGTAGARNNPGCPGESSPPSQLSVFGARTALFCVINLQRAANGLAALSPNRSLGRAAEHHSRAMDARNFFGHEPDGTPASRARKKGYMRGASWWMVGEALGWGRGWRGTPDQVVAEMMASPSHRAVILNGSFRDLGVGVAMGKPVPERGGNSAIYTAEFGARR